MNAWFRRHITQAVPMAPLALFRVLFGGMMLWSVIRFWTKGWITALYLQPTYFFTYYGFDWVQPLGETGLYALFGLMALAALCILLGLGYRIATVVFFLCFTYVELLDKTNYLNHYYFVSLISFWLIWLPANRSYSLDAILRPSLQSEWVPAWTINLLKVQIAILYVFAGIAKLHPDWLLDAMPLKLWLPAQSSLPLIGPWLEMEWLAYVFSWSGALYDLSIVFLLGYRPTRPWAYGTVIVFHLLTGLLFPIGVFPYLMIAVSLIFFQPELNRFFSPRSPRPPKPTVPALFPYLLAPLLLLQLLLPFRFLAYPGELFWTEQGYRFSWRVMLMEKSGYTTFTVSDPVTGQKERVSNEDFLTPVQEKMMSTQPDMILQFSHHLATVYEKRNFVRPEVRVEAYVSLNGRRSQLLIDPEINLAAEARGWQHKTWILPFDRGIKHNTQ